MSTADELHVYCPALMPNRVYVVQAAAWPGRARCWLVPVTLAGGAVDWARRREVPLPDAARLGAPAFDGGSLVRSIRRAVAGAVA